MPLQLPSNSFVCKNVCKLMLELKTCSKVKDFFLGLTFSGKTSNEIIDTLSTKGKKQESNVYLQLCSQNVPNYSFMTKSVQKLWSFCRP